MGHAKHLMMEQDDKREIAKEVAVRADYLNKCEIHDEFYDACYVDIENAYRVANSLISKNDPLVAIFKGKRTELTDMLKELEGMFPDCCPLCEKAMRD